MKAIATVDQNYGISKNGKPPLKLATLRRQQLKMFKGNAVLMSEEYFRMNGPVDEDNVTNIVVNPDVNFFIFDHAEADAILFQESFAYGELNEDGIPTSMCTSCYTATHIQALYNHEKTTGQTIYVLGDGKLFEKIIPFCEMVDLTVIQNKFDDLDDFFPNYIDCGENIFSVIDRKSSKQFKTEYITTTYRNKYAPVNPRDSIYNAKPVKMMAILGETSAGKDTIVKKLQKMQQVGGGPEIRPIVSFTDRPQRPGETNGVEHYFITKKEMDYFFNYCNSMILAKIEIVKPGESDGYRYCAHVNEMLYGKNTYVIDPNGLFDFYERLQYLYPGSELIEIYISVPGFIRKMRAKKRSGYNAEVYAKRCIDEKDQFENYKFVDMGKYSTESYVYKNYGFGQEKAFEKLRALIVKFFTGKEA